MVKVMRKQSTEVSKKVEYNFVTFGFVGDRQTDGRTDRQTDRQTDGQTDRQIKLRNSCEVYLLSKFKGKVKCGGV
jgi:hypothetical protein